MIKLSFYIALAMERLRRSKGFGIYENEKRENNGFYPLNPKVEKVQFREQDALKHYYEKINQSNYQIPWFKDKVLRFEFESEKESKKRKSFLSTG